MRIFLIFFLIVGIAACRKLPEPVAEKPPVADTMQLQIKLKQVFGDQLLQLGSEYVNAKGDKLKINAFKYFISNIKLLSTAGKEYIVPESYYLVDAAKPESAAFVIKDIPEGAYNKITFLIGVDSARNVSGAQTGALDPSSGMFWDWNSGYVMAVLEATSHNASNFIVYHVAGFSGQHSVLRWVNLELPQVATVKKGAVPAIHINADASEWFKTPNIIDVTRDPQLVMGPASAAIADNYMDMFKVEMVE